MGYKEIFTNIYENFGFGSTESRSGPGSQLADTEKIRLEIIRLCKEKNIKSIVDIPCGDFNWMKTIVYNFDSYTGGDIVKECVDENNRKYSNSIIKFIEFDLINDKIPDGELLFVRDVIGHLPIEDGLKVIKNILNSNCKYLLTTTWAKKTDNGWTKCEKGEVHRENEGVDYGRFYPVNLMGEPFNFPEPEFIIEEDVVVHNFENGNRKTLALWDIEKIKNQLNENPLSEVSQMDIELDNLTLVTGLWNIGRPGRDFTHYIDHFQRFLEIPIKMFIYIPKEYEHLVWAKRSAKNTFVKICELEDIRKLYDPHWENTQKIRNSESWYNQTGENGWLKSSPQASIEWYNPIVQSKMFLLNDSTIWNPFNTDYFLWLDAGITNTVYEKFLTDNRALDKIIPYLKTFLFLSYPYEAVDEIHGFKYDAINRYAGKKVTYVCRGGLFGGHKSFINQANGTYYSLLSSSLSSGYMGTEESIFSIMAHVEPHIYRRFELDGNGLIVKFIQALIDDKVVLADVEENSPHVSYTITENDLKNIKTNLYMLTFNFPEQVQHTINSMKKIPEWLSKPKLFLLDNSTTDDVKRENRIIAENNNFEYIDLGRNTGICGGRQRAAEHFHESDAEFMFFFEDDMTCNSPELDGQFCRNGFRKYIPNLYNTVHKIMLRDKYDFLKLTFTEVYFDNDKQCSWYNVPQVIRTRDWPYYDKLPISGLDPNVPLTNFKNIRNMDGLTYIDGEVYYANWPMIVSKKGNKKMFIDTTWAHPFEQTWMSHMYQLTKDGKLRPAVLLASPIWHDRIKHYSPEDRREN